MRGAPCFGLDAGVSYALDQLENLSSHGIFRKYEFVLEIGCGLGGRARWLSSRLGCRVVGLEGRLDVAQAGQFLSRRTQFDDQVTLTPGSLEAFPLRSGAFTHAWWLECGASECTDAALAEARRVVRPGGYFALRCRNDASIDAEELRRRLGRAGFLNVEISEQPWTDATPALANARKNLLHVLRHDDEAYRAVEALQAPQVASHWRVMARRD